MGLFGAAHGWWGVLTKTQNKPKRPETSQNELKPAETTPQKCKTTRNNPKFRENWNFLLAFFFETSRQNDQIWVF